MSIKANILLNGENIKEVNIDDKQISGAIDILNILKENSESYIVGGCVRDLLLGIEPHDYDITTANTPDEVTKIVRAHKHKEPYIDKIYFSGIAFGTVNIIHNEEVYEVTTFRREREYSDGRHPNTIEYSTSLEEDLARRDFTINAMVAKCYFDKEQNEVNIDIIDKYDGVNDIKNNVLRCVGDPDKKFQEDALRILRAIRFAIKYDLEIEENTFTAMINNQERLNIISKERITDELRKILTCGKNITPIFMKCESIIRVIIPEITPCVGFNQNNKYHCHTVYEHMLRVVDNCKTDSFEIKLAALLHDIGKPDAYFVGDDGWGHFYGHPKISYEICNEMLPKNLRLSRNELEKVLLLVRDHDRIVTVTEKSIKKALNHFGEETFREWIILRQADIDDHINLKRDNINFITDTSLYNDLLEKILNSKQPFRLKDLKINGNDIIEITNGKRGKHIGIILNTIFDEVLDEKLNNEHNELVNRAKELWNNGVGV